MVRNAQLIWRRKVTWRWTASWLKTTSRCMRTQRASFRCAASASSAVSSLVFQIWSRADFGGACVEGHEAAESQLRPATYELSCRSGKTIIPGSHVTVASSLSGSLQSLIWSVLSWSSSTLRRAKGCCGLARSTWMVRTLRWWSKQVLLQSFVVFGGAGGRCQSATPHPVA